MCEKAGECGGKMPKIKGINMNKSECYDVMTECK